ncbi:MAG TPA: Nramp family divalent metal transporter, partial [Burkholderiaceae bacterium]|nr:Nramp family divalent metal transporter [Burkholderiaceae bacterium]
HRSVAVPGGKTAMDTLRRLLAFAGPGYLVAVGYMDPGNWATSIAGGSRYGYLMLSVIVASNLFAMLVQTAAVRLGLATGQDLAQACRAEFSARTSVALWLLCEASIIACNLAEVLGMAIGLHMLFGIPLAAGVCFTALDVMLILGLQSRGFRRVEAVVVALVTLIGVSFGLQLLYLHPPLGQVFAGLMPTRRLVADPQMLYLAAGIVGATVMPHNLYLHSALVQTRDHARTPQGTRLAIRHATLDSNIALGLAMFVNAAILVVAGSALHRPDGQAVTELGDAYRLLAPVLGATLAAVLFGGALLASGLSSSITGTLAGQIVMEGFVHMKMAPAKRALLTRLVAIVPAIVATVIFGDGAVGPLLIFSQVALGLQLPFALVPLLMFTTRRRHLGEHAFGPLASTALWGGTALIVALNGALAWAILAGRIG